MGWVWLGYIAPGEMNEGGEGGEDGAVCWQHNANGPTYCILLVHQR
jgi:hypothetical protein